MTRTRRPRSSSRRTHDARPKRPPRRKGLGSDPGLSSRGLTPVYAEATLGPMRLCLVTPFSWSQPHDVNEHVAGVALELRRLGHSVTILASSNRAKELAAGRRALLDGVDGELVVVGPAVPISRRSRIGGPGGAGADLPPALAVGGFCAWPGLLP